MTLRWIRPAALVLIAATAERGFCQTGEPLIEAPRIWNDRDLAEWATPVATLNVRPSHYSEAEYYAAPHGEYVRTYPVYFPGREPEGYREMLRAAKPEPLIEPGARTQAEWIADGRRVFREMDMPYLRNYDAGLQQVLAAAEAYAKVGGYAQRDGTVKGLRWVPTEKGLALGLQDCASCHARVMPDGSIQDGAPVSGSVRPDAVSLSFTTHASQGFLDFYSPGESAAMVAWRFWAVPWLENDVHEILKSPDVNQRDFAGLGSGILPRFNGSPFYPTKVPDLIGIADRKYIDHTATHQLRGPEDVMRYAALVSCCDVAQFGAHRMLTDRGRRIAYRPSDDLLFALVQYIYSLEPPRNPNASDASAARGERVFDEEGCDRCHTPPLYTNNKLTRATGFAPPSEHPLAGDIMRSAVGTDPNLALATRKGTGLYKVPSLRGVWYRGLFGHDGSVTTLEEWFDAARIDEDFEPSGFKGYRLSHRAVPGHRYGLDLSEDDKAALIAFLKTL